MIKMQLINQNEIFDISKKVTLSSVTLPEQVRHENFRILLEFIDSIQNLLNFDHLYKTPYF